MEDFDELVSSLTPRQDNETISMYRNTVGIACPSCEETFDDMIVCKQEFNRLNLSMPLDLCTTIHDSNPILFTHKP